MTRFRECPRAFRQDRRTLLPISAITLGVQLLASSVSPLTATLSVLDLQVNARRQESQIGDPLGRHGIALLIDLNPAFHAWYVLAVRWDGSAERIYHLQNAMPDTQEFALDGTFRDGLTVRRSSQLAHCALWSTHALEQAAGWDEAYVPLCGGSIYLRNQVTGSRTELEAAVDFLRNKVPGGERLVNQVKGALFEDAQRESAGLAAVSVVPPGAAGGPSPAHLAAEFTHQLIVTGSLGIAVDTPVPGQLGIGQWYPARHRAGVYVRWNRKTAITSRMMRTICATFSVSVCTEFRMSVLRS